MDWCEGDGGRMRRREGGIRGGGGEAGEGEGSGKGGKGAQVAPGGAGVQVALEREAMAALVKSAGRPW